jgi:hypothetical protein
VADLATDPLVDLYRLGGEDSTQRQHILSSIATESSTEGAALRHSLIGW